MKKLLSLGVFLLTGSVVISGAGYALKVGMQEDSNFAVVISMLREQQNTVIAAADVHPQSAVLSASTSQECEINRNPAEIQLGSVTDYIDAHGGNSSFANREFIAVHLGINDYTGSADQNLLMLNILLQYAKCNQLGVINLI